jgi:UDP-sulfoquinovose synthase
MKVLVLGGDGYLGWPTAMSFASKGHDVVVLDNYLRRNMARETNSEALIHSQNLDERAELFFAMTGKRIEIIIGDCSRDRIMLEAVQKLTPDVVIHYAEQPSGPYSMRGFDEAKLTLDNNLGVTFNLIWAVIKYAPNCHIIKLGTMGEYGTPNIDIEEGWIEVTHNGRNDKFLYPRQAGSLYHTTKVLDTDLLWFYVRSYGIRVTDLMQGPVYGLSTEESDLDDRLLPNFHYDDIFGTVVNRFLVQAVADVPLTVYGKGGQTRGYLNLRDTLQCVELAMLNPPKNGELRIFNQFTELFSVNELAAKIQFVGNTMGLNVKIDKVSNPRKEAEEHYYNAKRDGLIELGLSPTLLTDDVISSMIEKVLLYKNLINIQKILPRVRWSGK